MAQERRACKAYPSKLKSCGSDEEDNQNTQRYTKSQLISGFLIDVDNGLEAFGSWIEMSEATRLAFKQRHLNSEELVYRDVLQERTNERADGREMKAHR